MNRDFVASDLAFATHSTSTPLGNDAESILASILKLQQELAARPALDLKMQPDRNGNVFPSMGGISIVVSDLLPTTKQIAHMRERKWSHRKRFQKERRFNTTYETVPCHDVYLMADKVVVRQEQYQAIIDNAPVDKSPQSFSMGFGTRIPDYVPMEPEPRLSSFAFDTFGVNPRSFAAIRLNGGV